MIYIGIDPGVSGALAIIDGDSAAAMVFDERSYIENLRLCARESRCVCCLEKVGSMPKQGVASTFKFGVNFGWIQGALMALDIPYELVTPQKWKREFSVTADKNTSIEVAKRLFPQVDLRRTPKCVKDHDGMAEALLLATFAKRHFDGR